jgi:diadenosine tetraphosphate (Ap4A) HIT family hydrolase
MHENDKKNAVQRGNFDPNTVFSRILSGELPAEILFQNDVVTAFMDIQPITTGHVLVIPNERAATLANLPTTTGAEIFKVGQCIAAAIRKSELQCEGVNLFLADGVAAGQTVFHVHLHVFPRYENDGFKWSLPDRYYSPPKRSELASTRNAISTHLNL